jgi:dihydroorotate dehydrogenase
MSDLYANFLRPILFNMDTENAHNFMGFFLQYPRIFRALSPIFIYSDPSLEIHIHTQNGEIVLPNPLVLAAGFDKDGRYYESLQYLGFGGIIVGTVTLNPREGNDRPRIVRRIEEEAAVNAMGLPGRGVDYVVNRLKRIPPEERLCPMIVSVGGETVYDFYKTFMRVKEIEPDAAIANVSCPNTDFGTKFERDPILCHDLVEAGKEALGDNIPLGIKLSHIYNGDKRKEQTVGSAIDAGIDFFVAINTMKVEEPRLSIGAGGLSGKPLFEYAIETIGKIRDYTGDEYPIIGMGGVFDEYDVDDMLHAGADAVGLYTSMAYRGPMIIKYILEGLVRERRKLRENFPITWRSG